VSLDHQIRQAGDDLVEYSQNFGEEETRSLTDLLFPSIFIASKRMSARAINRWLEEHQGIKFSAASVAKALRSQGQHFKQIADRVQPLAEHIALSCGVAPMDLLLENTPPLDLLMELSDPHAVNADHYLKINGYIESAANDLRKEWVSLDREIRFRCLYYFEFEPEETNTDDE
jgi:hypothetical protein